MRKELRKFEFVAIGLVVSMMFVCVFSERAFASFAGDIYVRADGSIDPSNAPIATSDNITYVQTANVLGTLTIQRDNIVFDGAGYTFTGSGSGYGITLYSARARANVTIKDTTTENFSIGIYLESSSGNTLSGNNASVNYYGIDLDTDEIGYPSDNNTLWGNNVTGNTAMGINLHSSSGNTLSGNNAENNGVGILLNFGSLGNTVSGNNATNNGYGILVSASSDNNTLSGNNVADNQYGILLYACSDNNTLSGNNVANNGFGIYLDDSSNNNVLSGNNVTANTDDGIDILNSSSNNTLLGNTVTANGDDGIYLSYSSGNTLSGNTVTANSIGIGVYQSSGNIIFHNRFVNNGVQVLSDELPNVWDNGYPSGGNYWSDYAGTDVYSGPGQSVPGSDGIGDTPYVIDSNNVDNYPFYSLTPLPQYTLAITVSGSGTTYPAAGNYTYNEGSNVTVTAYPGTGYQFDHWLIDGNPTSSTNPYTITMDANHAVEAFFIPSQYKVSFNQTGSGVNPTVSYSIDGGSVVVETVPFDVWVDSGSSIAYTYTLTVPSGTGIQYVFTSVSPDSPQTVLSPFTVSGSYKTQYYLTVTSPHDSPTPLSGWFDYGSNITASVTSPVSGGSDIRYRCTDWSGTGSVPSSGSATSVTFTIGAPSTIAWNWRTQYYLTVNSAHDTPSGAGWYDAGVTAHFSVSSPVAGDSGVRYVCTGYTGSKSGSRARGSITMNAPRSVTFTWKTQYYLTVNSAHGSPRGAGWYEAGVVARFSVMSPVRGPHGIRYVCTGYTGDASGSGTHGSIVMNSPKTVTFTWKP